MKIDLWNVYVIGIVSKIVNILPKQITWKKIILFPFVFIFVNTFLPFIKIIFKLLLFSVIFFGICWIITLL